VSFIHGTGDGVATGHAIKHDLYRAFHKQRCFELSVSETWTDRNNFDPPLKTLTPHQQKQLGRIVVRDVGSSVTEARAISGVSPQGVGAALACERDSGACGNC